MQKDLTVEFERDNEDLEDAMVDVTVDFEYQPRDLTVGEYGGWEAMSHTIPNIESYGFSESEKARLETLITSQYEKFAEDAE